MLVHVFGAYFGLAVSCVLRRDVSSDKEGATYNSDIFAMIGIDLFKLVAQSSRITHLTICFPHSYIRYDLFVAFLAFVQRGISRRRRSTPRRHEHVLFTGRLLRHGLRRLFFGQQRAQVRHGNKKVSSYFMADAG